MSDKGGGVGQSDRVVSFISSQGARGATFDAVSHKLYQPTQKISYVFRALVTQVVTSNNLFFLMFDFFKRGPQDARSQLETAYLLRIQNHLLNHTINAFVEARSVYCLFLQEHSQSVSVNPLSSVQGFGLFWGGKGGWKYLTVEGFYGLNRIQHCFETRLLR